MSPTRASRERSAPSRSVTSASHPAFASPYCSIDAVPDVRGGSSSASSSAPGVEVSA